MTSVPSDYTTDPGFDPAEDHIGPFYHKKVGDDYHCLFVPDAKNCNVDGLVHGGVLMTFADFCLCMAATDHYDQEGCVTVSFSSEFVAATEKGNAVTCLPNIIRKTGSMVFVTGELHSNGEVVMTFSSVVKRIRKE